MDHDKQSIAQKSPPSGLQAFVIFWFGQLVSILGSAMSWFAFTIWAWQTTGEATSLALVELVAFGPTLLLSPLAGALVDRWNRKLVLVLSDLGVGLGTLAVMLLYASDNLQMGHLYVIGLGVGSLSAFQIPAYAASVTMMLPKEQYVRAEGMIGIMTSASALFAPALAAVLLEPIGFTGIMVIDLFTFLVALGTLLWVHIPQPATSQAGDQGRGSLWKESLFGFRYTLERPSLWALQLLFAAGNLFEAIGFALIAPMILARTGNNEMALGSVQSIGAFGGIAGGVLLSVWGGPKRRIHGVLFGWALANMMGLSLMGLGCGFLVWAIANFFVEFFTPIVEGSNLAIWQSKVEPDVQGRVFAASFLVSQITIPIGMLLAGPLADQIFEPAMMSQGHLADTFGWLVGTGPGAGMGLIMIFTGLVGAIICLGGYAFKVIRNVEKILPDYAASKQV